MPGDLTWTSKQLHLSGAVWTDKEEGPREPAVWRARAGQDKAKRDRRVRREHLQRCSRLYASI